jgi:recombinational DNA repair ATPase RecF
VGDPDGAATEEATVLAAIRAARAKDLVTSATQVGPHRDDPALELDGREAGAHAPQGPLRAIMLPCAHARWRER